jgi:hypothetical protein
MAKEKSKIIPFGRYATNQSMKEGLKKPPTFDFLGFTHYCGKSKAGNFRVKRKTSRKKIVIARQQENGGADTMIGFGWLQSIWLRFS